MKKKTLAALLAAALAASMGSSVLAAPAPDGMTDASQTDAAQNGAWEAWVEKWETIQNDWTQLSLSPGADESQLNFAWYSTSNTVPVLKIASNQDMSDAQTLTVTQTPGPVDANGTQYYSNKATASGLSANTTYYYSYEVNGSFTKPVAYTTKDTDQFSFIYVGDPQIGSSNEKKSSSKDDPEKLQAFLEAQSVAVRNDAFNWNNTLNQAMAMTNNQASFVLSAGDQIQLTAAKSPDKDKTASEIEYAGYLSPELLKSLPVATTVGNHDADNENYTYHFNTPNASSYGMTAAGGDYSYTYGNALFIMLNTQDTNVAEHQSFIEETIAANPDCTWRIVTLHQDIYGSGEHSNEPEIANLRYSLVPIFEENDIDVVLTGHDHAYSRSQILKGGVKDTEAWMGMDDDYFDEEFEKEIDVDEPYTSTDEKYLSYLYSIMDVDAVEAVTTINEQVIDPSGILYMTANSSSGSKYYDLVARQQTYIANRWQEDVPTYSIVEIDDVSFTINTYRTDDNSKIDDTFTIVKSADKTVLNDLIAEAESLTADKDSYTADSYAVFESALTAAKAVAAKPDATESEIGTAYADLKNAMDTLTKQPTSSDDTSSVDSAPSSDDTSSTVDITDSSAGNTETSTNSGTSGSSKAPSNSPKTGDRTSGICTAVALLCLSGLGTIIVLDTKKKWKSK